MKGQLKTIFLLGALSALLLGVGGAIAPGALPVFAGLALLMNLGAYFFSDRMVLAMTRAREIPPEEAPWLHAMVEELARNAGVPKPRVCLIPQMQPNAFATGRNLSRGVVAVTEGIVRLLDRRELRGVIAHEIAHIAHRDILVSTIAAAMASVVSYAGHSLLFFGGRDGEGRGGGIVAAILAPFGAMLLQLAISRSREYLADEAGARYCGDPDALADALLKLERGAQSIPANVQPGTASLFIVNPFSGAQAARLFSTHPPTEERVRRLRAMAA